MQLTIRGVVNAVVQLAVTPNLSKEQGHCRQADPWQGLHGIADLPPHLVLKVNKVITTTAQSLLLRGKGIRD